MLKTIETPVARCDGCGDVRIARTFFDRNETCYELPFGWAKGPSSEATFCPTCAAKLGLKTKEANK